MICNTRSHHKPDLGFWSDRLVRALLCRHLDSLKSGSLAIHFGDRTDHFGESGDLRANIFVHRPRFFRRAILGGRLSIAQSYLQGDWDCDDLTSLFRIFVRNDSATRQLDGWFARFSHFSHRAFHWLRSNTRTGSRRNIAAHYDLGNDFYRLWLDETMAYSSGIFPTPESSLCDASVEKFDRICRKLGLRPSDQLLEIGAGWGGFAIHAAKKYGCQIATTTISKEQFAVAKQRIQSAGLDRRVTLLQQDYRDLTGQFDKLVSIEMIEAVGHPYLDHFFRRCSQLLRSTGSMVLQAIVLPERFHEPYLRSVDFIQRYVFPGGCLPSIASLLNSAGRATDLRLVHVEDFAPHYAETLRRWREAFQKQYATVLELGYEDSLVRLWNYYLCYCEAAFEERVAGVVQLQFDKPDCRRDPLTLTQHAAALRRVTMDGEPPVLLNGSRT